MKTRWFAAFALLLGVVGFVAGRAFTDEGSDEKEAWEKLAKPGKEHQRLVAHAGTWAVEGKEWFSADGKEVPFKGTSKMTAVLGDRYLREEMTAQDGSKPFEGIGYAGFDNATQKYVGTWMDTMGTGMMNSTGTYDEATKTATSSAVMMGPGGKEMTSRLVMKFVSDTEMTFEMYMDTPQGEQKAMELHYKKQ